MDARLYRNPQGFKRPLSERVLHQQFRNIIPDCVAAMFGRRGLDIGRSTESQKEDRAEVLKAVSCWLWCACVCKLCTSCVLTVSRLCTFIAQTVYNVCPVCVLCVYC
jgi:hypothetical protein